MTGFGSRLPLVLCLALFSAGGCNNTSLGADAAVDGAVDAAPAGCQSDGDCRSPKPRCETTAHACVACLAATDCPDAEVCNLQTHACVPGCSATHGCGDAGLCAADAGMCVACLGDADCHDAQKAHCDPSAFTCVVCLPPSDDCAHGTYCKGLPGNYSCASGCKDDTDCSGGHKCDTTAHTCVDCLVDGDCGGTRKCEANRHVCIDCFVDNDCPPGSVCAAQACVAGCTPQHGCAGTASCCGGACVMLANDGANCGTCGNVCGGKTCCAGACLDLAGDINNCGGCGMVCSGANATMACAGSQCTVVQCDGGFGDCDAVAATGCETDLTTSVANCGVCGTACTVGPNASPACVNSQCGIRSCDPGFADCDRDITNGCEIDTTSSLGNCGGCGVACVPGPNAVPFCTNSQCGIIACNIGFQDCDRNVANGCEVDTTSSINSCGTCGNACITPNGTPACVGSACAVAGCNTDFADCDRMVANGCEVNLLTDPNNCGACGFACDPGAQCVNAQCTCGNRLEDDGQKLCVPAGQTYALSGDHCYSMQVVIQGTLRVSGFDGVNGGALVLRSPSIEVDASGRIVADAAGHAGGATAQGGGGLQGTGAGLGCAGGPGSCVGQGGSGAGYGGAGGTPSASNPFASPCDSCDSPTIAHCEGSAGAASGTPNGPDYDLGSGGGSAGNTCGCSDSGGRGGAGGGSVVLLGGNVTIDGSVTANGETPPEDNTSCSGAYFAGGGGGSGGAVLVRANALAGTGALSATGGGGAASPGQADDWAWAGGGGGGGRVKVYAPASTFSGMLSATGGAGGAALATGQNSFPGEPGSDGSSFTDTTIPNAYSVIGCGGL